MQLQTTFNHNRTPNLNDMGNVKVKSYSTHKQCCNGLGLSHNKKAVAQLIPLLVLGLLVVGIGAYVILKPTSAITGTPATPPDETKKTKIENPIATNCDIGQLLDNNGRCITPPCPSGQARDNSGKCIVIRQVDDLGGISTPKPLDTPCTPSGYFKSAYAYHKKKLGDSSSIFRGAPLSFQFVVTSECEANYYLEAGLEQTGLKTLTILVTQPSACDGSPHYAGKFLKGSRNTQFTSTQPAGVIDVAFFPQDYSKEEQLRIVGGVYSGCFKDGGVAIVEIPPQVLSIKNSYSDTEITNSVTKII